MFKKILVPLDGSDLAEQALELAFTLAKKFGSEVLLLRVVIPEELLVSLPNLPATHYALLDTELETSQAEAQAYLESVRLRWLHIGVRLQPHVLTGTPPELIVAVAKEHAVDLIVMSTHGRSGFSRLLYGSVAEAVLRGVRLPMLLVPTSA